MSINFIPKVVGWEITKKCNMRCIHCGSRAGESRENELSIEEGLKLCDDLADLGCEVLTLSGGEPLTHPGFDIYAKRLLSRGIKTFLITNGLLIEDKLDRIVASGLKYIAISIDGTEDHHNYTRQNSKSYEKIFSSARLLRDHGIKVGAVTHVSKINISDLEDMYEKFVEEGFHLWQIQITFLSGRMKDHEDLSCSHEDLIRIAKFVDAKRKENKLTIINGDNFGYYSSYNITDTKWKGCFAGRWLLGIDADGSIKGCLSMPKIGIRTLSSRSIA